ncbi:hypothetical protein Landi51_10582 [Colletotrichum acutatum]
MIHDRANKNSELSTCFAHEFAALRRAKSAHSDYSGYSKWLHMHGRCHIIPFGKAAGARTSLTNRDRSSEELFESRAVSRPQQQGHAREETRPTTNNQQSSQQKKKTAYGTEAGSSGSLHGSTSRAQPGARNTSAEDIAASASTGAAAHTTATPTTTAPIPATLTKAVPSTADAAIMTMADPNATKPLTQADVERIIHAMLESNKLLTAASQPKNMQAVTAADLKDSEKKVLADVGNLIDAKRDHRLDEMLPPIKSAIAKMQSHLEAVDDAIREIEQQNLVDEKKSLEDDIRFQAVELRLMQANKDMENVKLQVSSFEKAVTAKRADNKEAIRDIKGDIRAGRFKQEALDEDQQNNRNDTRTIMDNNRSIKEKQDAHEKSQTAAMSELREKTVSSSKSSEGGKSADSITCALCAPTPKKGSSTRKK